MTETNPEPNAPLDQSAEVGTGLKWLFRAGAFMLIGMMILIYIGRDQSTIVNAPMPELDLVPFERNESTPTNQSLKGSVVVYHFWGTWCPPCRIEYPEFYQAYQQFKDEPRVKFISVSCEAGSGTSLDSLKSDTIAYLEQIDAPMPVYADPAVFTRANITKMLSAGGFEYPCTLLVDQTGVVRYLWRGYSKRNIPQLKERIEKLLAEPPKAQ